MKDKEKDLNLPLVGLLGMGLLGICLSIPYTWSYILIAIGVSWVVQFVGCVPFLLYILTTRKHASDAQSGPT